MQALCIPTQSLDPDAESYERAGSSNGGAQTPPPAPEPSGRDWLAEAALITDVQQLRILGEECGAFREFVGPVATGMHARMAELTRLRAVE